jgi:multiple sugar transport system substrate-binding protein
LVLIAVLFAVLPIAVFGEGQAEKAAEEEMESEDVTTIRYLVPRWASTEDARPERQVAFQSVIDTFEAEHPNYDLKEVISTAQDYQVDVTEQIEENTVDAVWIPVVWYPLFQDRDLFVDMSPYLDDDDREDFFDWSIEKLKEVNGELGGLWHNTDTRLYFYNTEIIPEAPETWEDVRNTGEEILQENPDMAPLGASLQQHASLYMWAQFDALGGQTLGDQGRPVLFEGENRQYWEQILTYFRGLVEDGIIPREATVSDEFWSIGPAIAGEMASFIGNSNFGVRELEPQLPEDEYQNWDAAPVPRFQGADRGGAVSAGWIISAVRNEDAPEKEEAAAQWVKHATEYAAQRDANKAGGWTPTRKSVFTDDKYYQEDRIMQATFEALEEAYIRPFHPMSARLGDVLENVISQATSGEMSVEEAIELGQEQVMAEYEDWRE